MKVVLISPYSDVTAYGLRSLSSYLKLMGHTVRMIFLPDHREEVDDFRESIYEYPAELMASVAAHCEGSDLIGISLMTYCFERVAQLTDYLRNCLNIPIVWGGIHPTVRPDECLQHAHFVCRGEGEQSLAKLAETLEAGSPTTAIPGLSYKQSGKVLHNPLPRLVQNLDLFPLPDYEIEDDFYAPLGLLPLKPMDQASFASLMTLNPLANHLRGETVYQTMASRGCPYHCAYCCNNFLRQLYKGQNYVRFLSVKRLISELVVAKTRFPFCNMVVFSDDSFFSAPRSWLEDFARVYRQEIGLPFRCLASPLAISEEKLSTLIGAGLKGVQVGIQSGSERTCRLYQRQASASKVIKAGKILARFVPPLEPPKYDIILDNPFEETKDIQDTLRLLMQIAPPYKVQQFSLVFLPGTDLYALAEREGFIEDERRQSYRKQFHLAQNIYLKLLLSLTGTRFPLPLLRILTHPKVLDWFNRPTILPVLIVLRRWKVKLLMHYRRPAELRD
ncbi:MAG: radical SAM protein [Desulforhabdus sp.]|nr:radical SAM protein [Desulforhabdus sp.]